MKRHTIQKNTICLRVCVFIDRKNNRDGWLKDTPLTNVGCYQANLIGDALKDSGVVIDHAFSSPSFRCIQTCNGVLEGNFVCFFL